MARLVDRGRFERSGEPNFRDTTYVLIAFVFGAQLSSAYEMRASFPPFLLEGRRFLGASRTYVMFERLAAFRRVKESTDSPVMQSVLTSTLRTCLQSFTGDSILSAPRGQRTSQRSSPFAKISFTSTFGPEADLELLILSSLPSPVAK